jgi:excisionase family DNA binding protein
VISDYIVDKGDESIDKLEALLKGYVSRVNRIADDDLLTTVEAAEVVGVSEHTIRRRILKGELAATRVGTGYKIVWTELLRWLITKSMPAVVQKPM